MLKIIDLELFFWKLMIFWIKNAIVDNIEYFRTKFDEIDEIIE
jgi:hypothetical protein